MAVKKEDELQKSDINDLIKIMNNPQHEADLELSGPKSDDSDERTDEAENVILDPF